MESVRFPEKKIQIHPIYEFYNKLCKNSALMYSTTPTRRRDLIAELLTCSCTQRVPGIDDKNLEFSSESTKTWDRSFLLKNALQLQTKSVIRKAFYQFVLHSA